MKYLIYLIRKYKCAFIIAGIILGASIAIHSFRTVPCPEYMPWYQCTGEYIYGYLEDWAIILGATGTFLLAFLAFWTIRERRRDKLADEINIWARNSLTLLTSGLDKPMTKTKRIDLIKERVNRVESEAVAMITKSLKFNKSVHKNIIEISKKCRECVKLEEPTMENIDEVFEKATSLASTIMSNLMLVIVATA